MAWTARTPGAQVANTTGSLSPALPSGWAAGDIAILVIAGRPTDTAEPATPTGWTKDQTSLREIGATDLRVTSYYRILQTGDTAPSIIIPASWVNGMSAQIMAWGGGVEASNPLDVASQVANAAAAATYTPPSVTTVTNGALVVSIVASGDDNALGHNTANGFTLRMSGANYDTTVGADHAIGLSEKEQATAGAVTMNIWSQTVLGNDPWAAITMAIRPAITPVITLNTTNNTETTDTTPTLEFTGDDPQNDSIVYQIQIDDNSDMSSPSIDKVSDVDAGFLNTVTGGDTSPFNDNEKISYTVQSALAVGTYYYRVRGKDPSGSNGFGGWSETRAFHVYTATKEISKGIVGSIPTTAAHQYGEALTSAQYTDIDTSDNVYVSKTGTPTQKSYFVNKTKGNAGAGFTVDFEAQVDNIGGTSTIALDATSSFGANSDTSGTSTFNWNHTVGSGSKRLLIVTVGYSDPTVGRSISSITFGGVALTKLRREVNGDHKAEIWYLVAPATSTAAILVTFDGIVDNKGGGAISLTGVDQTNPVDAQTGEVNFGAPTKAITTVTDNAWIIDSLGVSGDPVVGAGQTQIYDLSGAGEAEPTGHYASSRETGGTAGSHTMSWSKSSGSGDDYALAIMAVKPSVRNPSIKVDLWNFNTSAWDNVYNNTTPTANTDFSTQIDKTTGFANYVDGDGWIYSRAYTDYADTVDFKIDRFTITSVGGATVTSSRPARTKGQEVSTSNRNARTIGKTTATDSRAARTIGKESATSNRAARIKGAVQDSSSRNARIVSKDIVTDVRGARIKGVDVITSNRSAKTVGKETASSARAAKTSGILSANDNRNARTIGKVTASEARSARIIGKESATSSRAARLLSKDVVVSSRGAIIRGVETLTSSRAARIKGYETANDARAARTSGSLGANDNRSARIIGKLQTSDSRTARAIGKIQVTDSTPARTIGKLQATDNRNARTWGKVAAEDNRPARIKGKDTGVDSRGAKTRGQIITTDTRGARIIGKLQASDARNARTLGKITLSEARSARTIGKAQAIDIRGARIKGKDTGIDLRAARIKGKDTASDTRGAFTRGKTQAQDARSARTWGKLLTSDSRGSRTKGKETITSNRGARVIGKTQASDSRNARIMGIGGLFLPGEDISNRTGELYNNNGNDLYNKTEALSTPKGDLQ